MGSKNGKYVMNHNSFTSSTNEIKFSDPSRTVAVESRRHKDTSLPILIRRHTTNEEAISKNDRVTIVWVDRDLNNRPENIDLQIKIKNAVQNIRMFDQLDECETYIQRIGELNRINPMQQQKLLLIISTPLILTIILQLHELAHVESIYVYGTSKIEAKVTEQVLAKYTKVKGIFTTSQSLLAQIVKDQQ